MTQYTPDKLTDEQLRDDWKVVVRAMNQLAIKNGRVTSETFETNPHMKVLYAAGLDIYREMRNRGFPCDCAMAQVYSTEPEFLGDDPSAAFALTHNSKLAESEPGWGSVKKTELPRNAHAEMGEAGKKSSWKYPHHWVKGGKLGEDGVYVSGDMFLHKGGLNAAWAAAQGARSGEEASAGVKAHLEKHRKALGLTENDLAIYMEHVPMTAADRTFDNVRDFAVYARESEDFFPVLARTVFDGQPAQIHRHGDIVTIFDNNGNDITATYKDLLSEFIENQWPHDVVINGTILGWTGPNGHLSGDFVSTPEHARAKSYSFVTQSLVEAAGMDYTGKPLWSVWGLYRWFPANGGHRFTLPVFAGSGWMGDLGMAIQMCNIGPGFKGIEFENIDHGRKVVLTDSRVEFGLNNAPESSIPLHTAKFDFSFSVEAKGQFGVFEVNVTPHFAAPGDENPDFVIIESPAFPHGKLISGDMKKFDYSKDEVKKAKLSAQARGRAVPFVNWSHVDDEQMLAGQILKLWWDDETPFKFDDHTGRHIEGKGMLHQKSILTEPRAIWNAMRGNIRAISIEPMFDVYGDDGKEYPAICNMTVTGLGLTNHPAIGDAIINKVCTEDGTCFDPRASGDTDENL